MDFIKQLQIKRSDYKYASQARSLAESIKQLSAGIYTEEERFIYELLQNAVDAFIDTNEKCLRIKIEIIGNILCFMHNGTKFSEEDIDGLCDIGKSPKASDANSSNKKKVGYKGIGFKSVFMQSVEYVCVSSGNYCFKFDKYACADLMPRFEDGTLDADEIPWQVIPISCNAPSEFDISTFNVATFVQTATISNLTKKIKKLLQNPQFLLFLNANDIEIEFVDNKKLVVSAGRITTNNEVRLLCDKSVVSRWLVHTTDPITVDKSVREKLKYDFNTPPKLKTAEQFEISFAISLNSKGEMEAIKDSVVYTFLPTSYKNLGTPFLINANFITDAGRQQLHQTSEWNRLIFKSIPDKYFKWIAKLSPKYNEYYKVLPDKSPKSQDELTDIYSDSLQGAIKNNAFIPRLSDQRVLKVSEAIIDRINFVSAIDKESFINYVNKVNDSNFENDAFVPNVAISLMKSYGVYIFDKDALNKFISSDTALNCIDLEKDIQLIKYLYDYCHNDNNDSSELERLLPIANIIYDDNDKLNKAVNLFFPIIDHDLDNESENLSFMNESLYESLSDNILSWLGKEGLGIREMNKSSVVEHFLSHPECVDTENAIEIGRFLFSTWKKENYLEDSGNATMMLEMPFLSKNGNIIPVGNLYLSTEYGPEDDLESVYDEIEYITDEYVEDEEWEDWAFFLKKCGIRSRIDIVSTIINPNSDLGEKYTKKYDFLETAVTSLRDKKHGYSGYCGFKNPVINIKMCLHYFSYIDPDDHNYDLYKLVFSKVLSNSLNSYDIEDRINGKVSYWGTKVDDALKDHVPNTFSLKYNSFMEYVLANEQCFPTTTGGLDLAKNIFLNTPSILEFGRDYLPIININATVDDSWLKLLPFKKEMMLEDYLKVLEMISLDNTKNHKEQVSSIYQKLVELGYQGNPSIREWGKKHKLLSASGDIFIPTNQLSYITVDGFKNESQVYVGKVDRSLWFGIIELLETFGVKVITKDKICLEFDNKVSSEKLKEILLSKIDAITLLKGEIKTKDSFEIEKEKIQNKIKNSEFYHCNKIQLSYGNANDVITKNTYAIGNQFYYVGSLKPTKIEPLILPLSKHLDLKNVSDELLIVLITNNREDLLEYLQDKGYPTEFIDIVDEETPFELDDNNKSTSLKIDSKSNKQIHNDATSDIEEENTHNDKAKQQAKYEEYIQEYTDKVSEFMGADFSMPSDKQQSEHIISRYRILMYLKSLGSEFAFREDFNEYEYIRTDGYAPIPLAKGNKQVHPQGAKNGIWYLSPYIWERIVSHGDFGCLCTGNSESDFVIIKNESDIRDIADSHMYAYIRVAGTQSMSILDTVKSLFSNDIIIGNDDFVVKQVYTDRDVHLMLMVHQTKEPVLNSMFDNAFKAQGEGGFDLSEF